jgi:glycyl-tRNA synthetase beta chain
VERIAARAAELTLILGRDMEVSYQAEMAGRLSKADLVTGMVGEFPELQGIMGGYYAEKNPRGWDGTIVGPAIKTHYQPKGPSDPVPTGLVAVCVALADKLDTLVEFFRIGEKPTGSGDPYALRRAALGVIRIILENDLSHIDLAVFCLNVPDLQNFFFERLRVKLRGEGKRFDVLDAVFAVSADGNLVRLMKRMNALSDFLAAPEGNNLLAAYKRAANILRSENWVDPEDRYPDVRLMAESAERALAEGIIDLRRIISDNLEAEDYLGAMTLLARLRGLVDNFFTDVTVNDKIPALRENRLKLLAQFRDTVHYVADFSKIEG